jgi:hypothetical protein
MNSSLRISGSAHASTRAVTRARIASVLTLASVAAYHTARADPAQCAQYPIPWHPAAGTQAAAKSDLAALSPGAAMTWDGNIGTLTSALPLGAPLAGCTDGQDVGQQVFDMLAAHPALFQLDLSEWRKPEPFDCKYLEDNTTLSMGRNSLAGRPVAEDVFAYTLKRIDGQVQLASVNGTYLPVIGATIGNAMTACSSLTEPAAQATAQAAPLRAIVYSQCRKTGKVDYTPRANDGFSLSLEAWTWDESAGQALLSGQRTLRVIVDPANYTPELMSSAASCPSTDGEGTVIGFDVLFDVHTGEILNVKPGIDCVVC